MTRLLGAHPFVCTKSSAQCLVRFTSFCDFVCFIWNRIFEGRRHSNENIENIIKVFSSNSCHPIWIFDVVALPWSLNNSKLQGDWSKSFFKWFLCFLNVMQLGLKVLILGRLILWLIYMTHTYKFHMRNLYINRLIKTWTNMTDRLPLLSRAKDKQDAETSKLYINGIPL